MEKENITSGNFYKLIDRMFIGAMEKINENDETRIKTAKWFNELLKKEEKTPGIVEKTFNKTRDYFFQPINNTDDLKNEFKEWINVCFTERKENFEKRKGWSPLDEKELIITEIERLNYEITKGDLAEISENFYSGYKPGKRIELIFLAELAAAIEFKELLEAEFNEVYKINAESGNKLTERQSIILLRYLFEEKLFQPEKITTEQTKQALLINAIRGKVNYEYSNTYKWWNKIGDKKYISEFYTIQHLRAILKYLEPLDGEPFVEKIKKDLKEAETKKINDLGT